MPKKILQDIVTSNRPIRRPNIYRDGNKTKKRATFVDRQEGRSSYTEKSNTPRFIMWIFALISVVFLLFILLSIFSGTIVKIIPVQKQVSLDGSLFNAKKDISSKGLAFKMIVLKNSDSVKIPATKNKELQRKASGNIVIYNTYSSKSQKLIGRTRFETPDGKIYRIKKSVIVPGTIVKDGKIIPGSVETTVYSDIIGEKYNIGLVDFTIPGFKGGPRFSKFYARSKTPISGGYSGIVKYASDEDINIALKKIKNTLKDKLLSQAKLQVPSDSILYNDAVFFEFNDITTQKETTKDSILITETGKLYGVVLNRNKLSNVIADNFISSYAGGDVIDRNLDKLKFNIIDKEKFDPKNSNELSFKLSGSSDLVWSINKKLLANSIAGKDKKDFDKIISNYSSIYKAKATVRPFWESTFPKNSNNITIKVLDTSEYGK